MSPSATVLRTSTPLLRRVGNYVHDDENWPAKLVGLIAFVVLFPAITAVVGYLIYDKYFGAPR